MFFLSLTISTELDGVHVGIPIMKNPILEQGSTFPSKPGTTITIAAIAFLVFFLAIHSLNQSLLSTAHHSLDNSNTMHRIRI